MPIRIVVAGDSPAGQAREFADETSEIVIGRDATRCQLVLPADDRHVGRQHCALRRELGRYTLITNGENLVLLDGQEVLGPRRLENAREHQVQLGPNGPILRITPTLAGSAAGAELPTTDFRVNQPGPMTLMRSARAAGRWGLVAACVAGLGLLAVVGVGGLSYHKLSGTIAELDPSAAAQAAIPSVYPVLIRTPDGGLITCGTAWVVDSQAGLLATTAHIAELHRHAQLLNPDLPDDCPLVVRSPGENPQSFEVTQVTIHPGYGQFAELWDRYDPSRPIGQHQLEYIASAGRACDVALLKVSGTGRLNAGLKLADARLLRSLAPGQRVGLVGYSIEGISLGGVNLAAPMPQVQLGSLAAITDFFGSSDPDAERLLVQHSVPTAGGASGSPLLDADGRVIAIHNAGNDIGQINQVRIGSSAEIHYAQRVDLLQELLDHSADSRQLARRAEWERRIAKFYQPGRLVQGGWLVDTLKAQIQSNLSLRGEYDVTVQPLASLTRSAAPSATSAPLVWRQTIQLPRAGDYLVAVLGETQAAVSISATLGTTNYRGVNPGDVDWVQTVQVHASAPGALAVAVSAGGDNSLRLDAYSFTTQRKSESAIHDWDIQQWRDSLDALTGQQISVRQVAELQGELPPPAADGHPPVLSAAFRFDLPAGGQYLLSAVSFDEHPMQLECDASSPVQFTSHDESTHPAIELTAPGGSSLSGRVVAQHVPLGYSLRLCLAMPSTEAPPGKP